MIRTLVRRVLERAGYVVETAVDGCEAIEKIAAGDFDGVILDIMMPRLDGFEVVRILREQGSDLLGHTLVLTASHLKHLDELGVFDVVQKPFDIDHLLERTRACARGECLVCTPGSTCA